MLTTKAIFSRKEPCFEPQDCMIDKIVDLSEADYKAFSQNMLREHDFIADSTDSMFVDRNGIWHGMLVMDAGSDNAILVESEGSNYARYASFMPSIKPHIESHIQQLADKIIKDGTQTTKNGRAEIGFDEIKSRYGVMVSPTNGIGLLLLNALNMSDEVAELEPSEDSFDIAYYLDYCSNLDEEHRAAQISTKKLADILSCNFEDVHLCHRDIDDATATISELSDRTLTAEGKQAWADVLGADVHRVYSGMYGLQIEVSGVKAARLYEFGNALAGYCSEQDYEKWFTAEETAPAQTMGME